MTVASQNSKVLYAGSASSSTTAFAIPFLFLADADITVVVRGTDKIEHVKVLGADYTLSGAGDPNGGLCTMSVAPVEGEVLAIYRDPAIVQETDYVENDAFPAETHERALDRLTMICQALAEKQSRNLALPVSSGTTDIELKEPVVGNSLYWGADGKTIESRDILGDVDNALSKSTEAVNTANSANSTANSASSTANSANTKSEAAVTTADEAKAIAQSVEGVNTLITGNMTIHVATDGSDVEGDGSSAKPFATLGAAVAYLSQFAIKDGAIVTISIAAGTYTSTSDVAYFSHPNGNQVRIQGAGSDSTIMVVDAVANGLVIRSRLQQLSGIKFQLNTATHPTAGSGLVIWRKAYLESCWDVKVDGFSHNVYIVGGDCVLGSDVALSNSKAEALRVSDSGNLYAFNSLQVDDAGTSGILLDNSSFANITGATFNNSAHRHLYVVSGSFLIASNVTTTGTPLYENIVAVSDSRVVANNVTLGNAGQIGVSVYEGSQVRLTEGTMGNCGTHGVYCASGSIVEGYNFSIGSCGLKGFYNSGATILFSSAASSTVGPTTESASYCNNGGYTQLYGMVFTGSLNGWNSVVSATGGQTHANVSTYNNYSLGFAPALGVDPTRNF